MSEIHIIAGTGGHAQILLETLLAQNKRIIGATEKSPLIKSQSIDDIAILGDDDYILKYDAKDVMLVNGIGWVPGSDNKRKAIFERFESLGYFFANVVSNSAHVSDSAILHQGVQALSGAVIQTGCTIGANTILNTQSSIDHHTLIGKNCHIAPGAIVCGNVRIGDDTFIGAGAIIINNIEVGDNCVIGAGATLKENLSSGSRYG